MATIEEQALKNALDGDNEALAETLDKLMPGELRALALAARDLALCAARQFPTEQTPNAGVQVRGARAAGDTSPATTDYTTVQQAEMAPDLYAGQTCDQVRPRWVADVEKEGRSEITGCIELNPATFPPGTRVLIQMPCCPDCGIYVEGCECGFDWSAWRDDKYS